MPWMSGPANCSGTGGYEWGPFETDGVRVTLVQVVSKKSIKLLMRRKRSRKPLPDVIVMKPPWNNCNLQASRDWRYVLGACQIEGKHDPFMYDVAVYGAATGEKVGQIAIDTSPSAFVVWNGQLLYFSPGMSAWLIWGQGKKYLTVLPGISHIPPSPQGKRAARRRIGRIGALSV